MIEQYLKYIELNLGYSQNTIIAYRADLHQFADYISKHKADARWSAVTTEDIERYIQYLSELYKSNTTINRKLATIKSIYRYFKTHKMLVNNPAQPIYFKREATHIVSTLNYADIYKAYQHANDEMKIIIALLASTGIRISELSAISKSDIMVATNGIIIHGKGKIMRIVYISEKVMKMILEWAREKSMQSPIINRTDRDIRYQLYKHFRNCGINGPCNPHSFRHTIATKWASQGANNSVIAKALGHKRLETCQKYIDLAQIDTKNMMVNNSLFN